MLAVRKNRPGALYVYMNPQGAMGATNLLLGKEVSTSTDFIPSDLSDCAWYGDLMIPGTDDAAWLAARGIAPVWDAGSGRLGLEVTNVALFDAHRGDPPRTFTLTLLPGGTLTTSFQVGLFDDMSVSVTDGKSLTEDFYIGQKRTVSVSGFAGSGIKYAAVQEGCGDAGHTNPLKNQNRQWKAVSGGGLTAGFPSCAVDARGNPVLDVSSHAYDTQNYTGSLDIYAFYPNRFQPSHTGWSSKTGSIVFFSEDYLNDSMEVSVRISEPKLVLWAPSGTSVPWNIDIPSLHNQVDQGSRYAPVILNLDGNELFFPSVYRSYDGGEVLDRTSFDDGLYRQLLAFRIGKGTPVSTGKEWLMDAVGTDGSSCIYIARTLVEGHDLFTVDYDKIGSKTQEDQVTLGSIVLQANSLTGLYDQTSEFWVAATRMSTLSIRADASDMVNGWHLRGMEAYESHYFLLLEDADGNIATNRIAMNISAPFRGGDTSRLSYDFSGGKITYSVGSHVIEPVYEYEWTDDTHFKWIYDAANQVTSYNGQFVPGELLVPYGDQIFSIRYGNKWDHRSTVVSRSIKLMYFPAVYALYAFNPASGKVFVTGHRNADLLARKGAQMSHACREFCLQVAGVNFGEHFHLRPAKGSDADYASGSSLPANARGRYSVSSPLDGDIVFNGATVPIALYRETGMSAWTENSSRDMTFKTTTSSSGTATWRYLLNWGGFGDLKTINIQDDEAVASWTALGYEDRFGSFEYGSIYRYSSANIPAYLNPAYSKVFSTSQITVGYVDSIRYYLWLGSQSW